MFEKTFLQVFSYNGLLTAKQQLELMTTLLVPLTVFSSFINHFKMYFIVGGQGWERDQQKPISPSTLQHSTSDKAPQCYLFLKAVFFRTQPSAGKQQQ